jgi:GT2 family glycosyltransferase
MHSTGATPLEEAIALATNSPFGIGGSRFHYSRHAGDTDTVYLGAFRRQVFERVGGFNPRAVPNEDYELNYRIRESGGRIYYTPCIWANYYVRPSLSALWRQYFRYGGSKAFVIREHPKSVRMRHLVAPAFVGGLVAGAVLAAMWPLARIVYGAALLTYMLLALAFSARQATKHGWRYFPLLPPVFLILHLAWGAGFWAGVWNWWIWRADRRGRQQ